MNAQPNSPERSTTADSANVSFTPPSGLLPSEPAGNLLTTGKSKRASAKAGSGAKKPLSAEKLAIIARVRERLTGPPSVADGTVPNKELIMENRLRAWVLADSDEGAARLILFVSSFNLLPSAFIHSLCHRPHDFDAQIGKGRRERNEDLVSISVFSFFLWRGWSPDTPVGISRVSFD